MKFLVVLSCLLAASLAENEQQPILASPFLHHPYHAYGAAPLAYNYAPVTYTAPIPAPVQTVPQAYTYAPTYAIPAVAPPAVASSQFAAQDEFGNTQYGYANINSAKQEAGNVYTGVTGGYQYVDANGELQTVSYIADALGFRVVDSRLPKPVEADLEAPVFDLEPPVYDLTAPEPVQDTEEVAKAKEEFQKVFDEVSSRQKRESDPALVYGYNSIYAGPQYYGRYAAAPYYYNNLLAYNNIGHPFYGYNPRFAYGFYH